MASSSNVEQKSRSAVKGKVYVSTVIDSPVESVWAVVGSFFDLSWAGIPSRHESEGYAKEDNVIGKNRHLTLPGGKVLLETLTSYSSIDHEYTYTIVDTTGAFPGKCDNYHSRLSFKRVTDKNATFAEWSSEFDSDEATVATVEQTLEQGVYTNGFNLLRKALADRTI